VNAKDGPVDSTLEGPPRYRCRSAPSTRTRPLLRRAVPLDAVETFCRRHLSSNNPELDISVFDQVLPRIRIGSAAKRGLRMRLLAERGKLLFCVTPWRSIPLVGGCVVELRKIT